MDAKTIVIVAVVVVALLAVAYWYAKSRYGAVFSFLEFMSNPLKFLGGGS